jgi:hypothetical protein
MLLLKKDFDFVVDKFFTLEFLINIIFFYFCLVLFSYFNRTLRKFFETDSPLMLFGVLIELGGLNSFFELLDLLFIDNIILKLLFGVQKLDLLLLLNKQGTLITFTIVTCLF